MKTYKIVLCYDGSRYNGWQKQGNTDNTLQEKLEKILTEIAGVETEIAGSGRTDAGTHAKGQVASFRMDWKGTDMYTPSGREKCLPFSGGNTVSGAKINWMWKP